LKPHHQPRWEDEAFAAGRVVIVSTGTRDEQLAGAAEVRVARAAAELEPMPAMPRLTRAELARCIRIMADFDNRRRRAA